MGRETLEGIAAAGRRAADSDREREERIANCEMEFSDGHVSSWAAGLTQQKGKLAETILANGGTAYFWRCELVDAETGASIDAKIIDGQYGLVWIIDGADERKYGRFITAHAKRAATMAKKGVRERIVIFEAAATADLRGAPGAKGLSGATSVRAITRPADWDVEYTGYAGANRDDAEGWIAAQSVKGEYLSWQEKVIA